ncbi:MAG: hypothetical protein ACRYFZ_24915 [Janthinobacterium lividum]
MRLYLVLLAVLLAAGCTKVYGPQRLDFVNTTRYTSSNRTGLNPADTLASRLYAENTDANGPKLGRIVVTVRYQPRRNPFLYPIPLSSFNRDSIDKSAENFVFLDSTLASGTDNFSLFTTYGVRTTTGAERWQYELRNTDNNVTANRAVQLSMRRPDSLYTYQDYTLRLVVPAVGVPGGVRLKSSRRFLSLLPGLALPGYTVLKSGAPGTAQAAAQKLVDLVVLADGLTIVVPESFTPNTTIWPSANRRATLIYPAVGQIPNTFAGQVTDSTITQTFRTAIRTAIVGGNTVTGKTVGPVKKDDIYAFRTNEGTPTAPSYRYGLLQVLSIPTTTTTTATAGLQLQVRMAKQ